MTSFLSSSLNNSTPVRRHESPSKISILLMLAGCSILLSPIISFRMGVDQGIYAFMASELLHGRWPYIDTWEHSGPGGAFLHAFAILLFGKSGWAFRLFDLLFQLVSSYLVFRITFRLTNLPASFLAAFLFCLIYQGYGPWNTGQREGFGMVFVLAGYWLFLTRENRAPWLTTAGIGLGLGLALPIKPTLIALSGFYLPLLGKFRIKHVKLLILAAVFLALPMAAFILFYWSQGALQQMYEACITYNRNVYIFASASSNSILGRAVENLGQLGVNAKVLALVYIPFLFFGEHRKLRTMLFLGYLGSLFAVLAQGTFAGYHYLPGLALGTILIGTMFHAATSLLLAGQRPSIGSTKTTIEHIAAILLIGLAIAHYHDPVYIKRLISGQFLERPAPDEFTLRPTFDFAESWETAEYIRQNSNPNDRIQIWGMESLVYYLAERSSASRFQSSNPLVQRVPGKSITEMQQSWRAEFLESIRLHSPKFIAVVRGDNWWWAPGRQTSWELLDDFPQWKAIIFDQYDKDREIGRFVIFRRRDPV